MNQTLSRSAQSVQTALSSKGFAFEVMELPASTRTAQDAANTIGCEVAQIVKSLIFKTVETNRPILILASGINRVDEKKIVAHVGEKFAKADAAFTREATGFAIGGIPPAGHKNKIETYIDEDLLQYDTLWAAAGTRNAVFSLKPVNLKELTGGKVIPIK